MFGLLDDGAAFAGFAGTDGRAAFAGFDVPAAGDLRLGAALLAGLALAFLVTVAPDFGRAADFLTVLAVAGALRALPAAFFAGALATAFFGTALRAGVLPAAALRAGVLEVAAFFGATFFGAVFFAAAFLGTAFPVAAFFTATVFTAFLAPPGALRAAAVRFDAPPADFFAAGTFFAAVFPAAGFFAATLRAVVLPVEAFPAGADFFAAVGFTAFPERVAETVRLGVAASLPLAAARPLRTDFGVLRVLFAISLHQLWLGGRVL